MKNAIGKHACETVKIITKEYGNFAYACHCDTCRRINSGTLISVDNGPAENIVFSKGQDRINSYPDEDIRKGFGLMPKAIMIV